MKLISERDCLTVPDRARALEMGMQLENIGDFFDGATTDEKNKILHLLFEAIYYDFDQKRMVRFKPLSEYAPIFQLAAPFSGWIEKEGFIFSTSDETLTCDSRDAILRQNKISARWFVFKKVRVH